jgi:hypothetical protein
MGFNGILILSTDSRKIFKYKIFTKIRPAGAELLHADGRTKGQKVVTKLIVAFLNCTKKA